VAKIGSAIRTCRRFTSPLQRIHLWSEHLRSTPIERILPFSESPWEAPVQVEIRPKDDAIAFASRWKSSIELYTDTSIKDGRATVAVWQRGTPYAANVGPEAQWTPVHAELEAIVQAARMAPSIAHAIIYSDCKYAIEALNDKRRSDTTAARMRFRANAKGKEIKVCWIPGYSGVRGNEEAHRLATTVQRTQERTALEVKAPMRLLRAAGKKDAKERIARKVVTSSTVGRFTKLLDASYQSGHTRERYDSLNAYKAAALAQMRTGISKLNGYLHTIHCHNTPVCKCSCNLVETVQHFLFVCPNWVE